MTDDRNCHGQLTLCDRKIMDSDWVHKDYSMESFTKFVFKIQGFHAELGIFGFSRERTISLPLIELSYCFAGLSDKGKFFCKFCIMLSPASESANIKSQAKYTTTSKNTIPIIFPINNYYYVY